ncbi:hypothetical protein A2767_03470 [Candidatus Roizmanbacteria bacterium RIFCSPHIGHO2_01_FULL_35_10]|uniref:Uncharacterized protein n=1 Tax=Candidatus Roizmanbacteria bacterium RIFCSPLOWO2_01_FULL_35_13 TaxID=1802055 RepID=A0A1F7IES4_9BACT|nr:MAG: hypothetical protein A2767_03470 [Candidatus Roizmanbacteria bacterium RIFCSPHIGHO2_01_FULL_35_10]OGK41861.1 MAG: hypothetical protein A3A74_02505 [Candidatus Roizmanbacteria bacterium RIFCSPLOWO2_01_FULL_35_13]
MKNKKITSKKAAWEIDMDRKIVEVKAQNKRWKEDWQESEKRWDKLMKRIEYLKPIFIRNHIKRMALIEYDCKCEDHLLFKNNENFRQEIQKTIQH